MKNEIENIKDLLDKYYEAETNENEEKLLSEYFSGDVASELMVYKPHFEFNSAGYDDGRSLSDDFDDKFFEKISKSELKVVKKKNSNFMWYSAVAATFLIAFGLFRFFGNTGINDDLVYDDAVEIMILISEKMDTATGDLHKLGAFESDEESFDAFRALEIYGKHINNQ